MTKGAVNEAELPPLPEYEYFSNGEYLNPQTHPIFLFFRDNRYSWFEEWCWKWVKKDGKEITLVGIEKNFWETIYGEVDINSSFHDFVNLLSSLNFKRLKQVEIGKEFINKRWQVKKEIIL